MGSPFDRIPKYATMVLFMLLAFQGVKRPPAGVLSGVGLAPSPYEIGG